MASKNPLGGTPRPKSSDRDDGRNTTLLQRLLGQETEYASLIITGAERESEALPGAKAVYEQIVAAIVREQPVAEGMYDACTRFLASGGAISFATDPALERVPGGLIEVATPEVRGPGDLLACQRSIDAMVTEAAETVSDCDLRILKNNADGAGHVYGSQENYEAIVATGIWLTIYRGLLLVACLVQMVGRLIALPAIIAIVGCLILRNWIGGDRSRTYPTPADEFASLPRWFTTSMVALTRLSETPTIWVLKFIARYVAFRPQRRYLTALLVSRVAICGAGDLDHVGRFRLSAKAMAIDKVSDIGGFRGERPIYVFGHWCEQLCSKSLYSWHSIGTLMKRRQRLQIGLSDSNLADLTEYVKFGSVSLILDLLERGGGRQLPVLRRPIASLSKIAGDWNLVSRVATNRGSMSALEIQRAYHRAATSFVQSVEKERRGEAAVVLQRWGEAIELAAGFRRDASQLEPAVGRIDWMTKRWMLDQLNDDATWAEKKKVDLRYHELTADGYFRRLESVAPELRLADQSIVERRRRSPPSTSPAAHRGWLIREFAGCGDDLRSDWSFAMVGRGRARRRIEYGGGRDLPAGVQAEV